MKQKHLDYLAPEAEILVVRFEGNLLNSSPQWSKANTPGEIEDEDTERTYGF